MPFSALQVDYLMKPLKETRVSQRKQAGRSLSYLEAWDVKAHLTRIFGFGGWDSQVSDIHLVSCEKNEKGNYEACYQATVTLTVRDEKGHYVCEFAEAAVGSSSLPQKGEALDMALKTAESDALKRAAINLGTQFGLSLYNNGSLRDVIGVILVDPRAGTTLPEPDSGSVNGADKPLAAMAPLDVLTHFTEAVGHDSDEQRILHIAGKKEEFRSHLNDLVEVDGQNITLARFADLIATGQFGDEQ